ncbi:MAG: hypothetical protein DCF20_20360 [Pseudanabaena sp.]|nr:MAG: hypothetical protein DCF20_20360 [Pseudanabaena sp.]
MRNQVWYVATLLGFMCLIRFGLSAIGYVDPHWLMQQLGAPLDVNLQMPYIIRVWAIRDMVLAILVVFSNQATLKVLLCACIAIDITDIWSAHLSGLEGLFSEIDTWSLKLTAIAALLPETAALALIMRSKQMQEE